MTLVSVTAYHSFSGEVEASNTPTIRRLTPSCRHQLPRIALVGAVLVVATKGMTEQVLWVSPDLIVVTGLSIWTIARQSIPGVVGILLYQLVALGNLALSGGEVPVSQAAFAMHTGLRVVD